MTDALVGHSRAAIERGSRSFAAAARLFDAPTRADAYMLYAWCRHCDDVIDGQDHGHGAVGRDPEEAAAALVELRRLTQAALAGDRMDDPVFAALQQVAERRGIPERFPLELLDGFGMDVAGRRYRTIEDTLDYAYHVAGVVGVMMAMVMGTRDLPTLRRAQDLGIALQLTNIARDVVEDARGGRVYLPEDWLAEGGVPADAVATPAHRAAVFEVARRLVEAAEPFYTSARWGLTQLRFRSAWAVAAARGVYREIGVEVLRRGPEAWDERVVVGRPRKVWRALEGGVLAARAVTVDRLRRVPERPALWTAF